jgi:hypothetical protein
VSEYVRRGAAGVRSGTLLTSNNLTADELGDYLSLGAHTCSTMTYPDLQNSRHFLRPRKRNPSAVLFALSYSSYVYRVDDSPRTRDYSGRWYYFAYGSNLNSDVFEGRRGVTPLDVRVGVLEGYRLAFNMPGVPLLEPSFASVEPSEGDEAGAAHNHSPHHCRVEPQLPLLFCPRNRPSHAVVFGCAGAWGGVHAGLAGLGEGVPE